jgi:hypothetical protein
MPLFLQNIIACIWDFDKTLIPGYMQEPLFEKYQVDPKKFWQEVQALKEGIFEGLNNDTLRRLGAKISFYPGLPDFFDEVKNFVRTRLDYCQHEIRVEHYIVSTGLRQMILGSKIAPYIDGVWGCEFVENPPPPGFLSKKFKPQKAPSKILTQIAYALDNTTKTRAVFEINKGTNKIPDIGVDAKIPDEDRRVPIQNMIYVADGPSDIPVFSIINQFGGRTFAVYRHGSKEEFAQVNSFQQQGRVQSYGEANYSEGSQTAMWIKNAITEIADLIVKNREQALGDKIGKPPKHLD